MMTKIFGRKKVSPAGWQVGDPAEMGKGLEQPLPRVSRNPVRRKNGVVQVEEVRAAIEDTIRTHGYTALAMPERVFINVYHGMSFFVAGPATQWKVTSPRDWVTVVAGLEMMGELVAAEFVTEVQRYKRQDVRNADGEQDHFEGLKEILTRWGQVDFDREKVLQRYLESDYWGHLA